MTGSQAGLAKDIQRYHEDDVQAAHTVPVAVTFRLYEKLSAGGAGTFKPRAKNAKNATEPFWMYLFQECWDKSVRLTHEIYVDAQGCYNHVDCHEESETDDRPDGMDPFRSVVLSSAHYQNGVRRAYLYHALLSPFQMPKSRLDEVIPGGSIPKGASDKYARFAAWSKKRDLNRVSFNPMEEKRGASRCLWAPWMKAWALADECGDALYDYQKYVLDQADRIKVANLALSLAGALDLKEYVSMDNVRALLKDVERIGVRLADAAKPVAEYVERPPFMQMLDDIDADDTEDAMAAALPYLSDIYQVLPPEVLSKYVRPRYFEYKFTFDSPDTFKLVRRSAKALWEVNLMFARAIKSTTASTQSLTGWVSGVQWWSKKIFGAELRWENGQFEPRDLERMRKAAARAPFYLGFVFLVDAWNAYGSFQKFKSKSVSERDVIGAAGALSSALSSAAKVTESLTPDPGKLKSLRDVAKTGLAELQPAEQALLRSWTGSRTMEKLATVARNSAFRKTLGVVSGEADMFAALIDMDGALAIGDNGSAFFYGLIAAGGLCLVLTVPLGGAIWLAAAGQSLELVGLVGAAALQSSDLEIWLRFCSFGKLAARGEVKTERKWTGGHALSQMATSPRLQIAAFSNIVYHMDVGGRVIEYERLDPLFELTINFTYRLPENGQLYLHVEVLREDGNTHVVRALSPWTNATKRHARDNKTVVGLSDCFRAESVLIGVKRITVGLKLDIDKSKGVFFPEDDLLVESFDVAKLPHVG